MIKGLMYLMDIIWDFVCFFLVYGGLKFYRLKNVFIVFSLLNIRV